MNNKTELDLNKVLLIAMLFLLLTIGYLQNKQSDTTECKQQIVTQEINPFDFTLTDINGVIIKPHTQISYRSIC